MCEVYIWFVVPCQLIQALYLKCHCTDPALDAGDEAVRYNLNKSP
jgi:hypothetical protein